MTVPAQACGGAAAVTKPGLARTAVQTTAAIAEIIALRWNKNVAAFLAPIIAGFNWDISSICSQGDPGDPGLTQQDLADLADYLNLVRFNAAITKLQRWWAHLIFPFWCDCADGTAPPQASVGSPPAVSVNPNMPPGGVGPSCWDSSATIRMNRPSQWNFNVIEPQSGGLPGWTPAGDPVPQLLPVPLPTHVSWATTMTPNGLVSPQFTSQVRFLDSAGLGVTGGLFAVGTTPAGTIATLEMTPPASSAYLDVRTNNVGSQTSNDTAFGHLVFYCPGQAPGNPVTPCCPPDSDVSQLLQRILGYERIIIGLIGAPTSGGYMDGTRHANLSGTGSFALVDKAQALRLELHAPLPPTNTAPGTPTYHFDFGFVTPFEIGSAYRSSRVTFDRQLVTLPTFTDQIGFTLLNGLVLDAVELLPA